WRARHRQKPEHVAFAIGDDDVHGFSECSCCRRGLLQDRLYVGLREIRCRETRRRWQYRSGRWHRVEIVRWTIANVADTHSHAIALDPTILDPHEYIALLRQVVRKPRNYRRGPRLIRNTVDV